MAAPPAAMNAAAALSGVNEFWSIVGSPEFSYKASPAPDGEEAAEFPMPESIERLSGLSAEEMTDRYVTPGLPVILTDRTADWAASAWTFDTFRSRVGTETVSVDVGGGTRQTMLLSQYLDLIGAPTSASAPPSAPPSPSSAGTDIGAPTSASAPPTAPSSPSSAGTDTGAPTSAPAPPSAPPSPSSAGTDTSPPSAPPTAPSVGDRTEAAPAPSVGDRTEAAPAPSVGGGTEAAPVPYLRLWHYEQSPCEPSFSSEFDVPTEFVDWFNKLPAKFRPHPAPHWIFIGPPGAATPLHLDPFSTHAWFAQIQGHKRFTLYPPIHTRFVCNGQQFLDPDCPDSEAFPQYENARRFDCVLGPGDLLFLPCGWAHSVESLDHSISLTHNFLDEPKFKVIRMTFLMFKMKKVMGQAPPQEEEEGVGEEMEGAQLPGRA